MSDLRNQEPNPLKAYLEGRLSRRQFLAQLALVATGGLLAACQVRDAQLSVRPDYDQVLASPQPHPTAEADETPVADQSQENEPELENFLLLSAALTGFRELNPAVGRIYLESLQANSEMAMTPAELYEQAGLSGETLPTLEALNEAGIFDQEGSRSLADKIIEYWYTGVYDQPGEEGQAVATTVDALTWQALTYTKPPTLCGPKPGFWAERPEAAPMPPVNQVSFPEPEASGGN